ncbi:cytochrome P450 2F3-like [Rhinatrema bivittatum]|uniref:cytochrome P450 2F3-like n=1 Tax=Rhinatrema bivittatum TaxID=194408 RepID=UPI00112A301D|nr:cytochrome P450 2F3-like [Rhinatrema bivittatum]
MDVSGGLLLFMIICISCLMLFRHGKSWKKERQLPPGPTPLPLIGNLLQLNMKDMVKSLSMLSEKYGSVYTIYLGSQPSIVLYGYKAVKEALIDQGDEFSGRGEFPVVFRFTQGNGIAFTNGEKWKNLRRFALQTLRNFGVGKRTVEQRIQEEAYYLVQEFKKTNEKPFDPTFVMSKAVSNVICSVVFGNRFDYQDKSFLALLSLINENFQLMSSVWGTLYNIFPNLMYYLPGPHNKIFSNFEKLKLFVLERIKMHDELFDANCPRDFIDCFLTKMKQEEKNPQSSFHTETLVMTTHNLFFGGTETVSTTLRYGFLILMKYPEIQAKVHEEIERVIGRNRCPSIEDRSRMPYSDAVIHEVQRFADIIPMSLPHRVIRDTQFQGYTLPMGTNIIPVLTSVHYDPTQYKNPNVFDPQNFLDDKVCLKKKDAFMPFSSGKRICLGESLARMELFLYFTTILQNFQLKPLVSPEKIDLTPQCSGLGNVPRPYQFCVLAR